MNRMLTKCIFKWKDYILRTGTVFLLFTAIPALSKADIKIAKSENFLLLENQQQKRKVTGIITESTGEPLVGVSVLVKKTSIGALTDANGKYTIECKDQDVLTFNYLGFKTVEITVGAKNTIDVEMHENETMLEEVVVTVAYGTQKKVTVTGSLSTVSGEDLAKSPNASIANVMAGTLSGVSTVQYSGQPGADDPDIFVRGIGSIDAERSKPLMLVDGVERSFFRMNPNEIDNITVLKDASATAVFGVRGANGVILVTTKRGQEGKAKISVSSSIGVVQPMDLPQMANSYDHAINHNEMKRNDGAAEIFSPKVVEMFRTKADPIMFPDTNWEDFLFKKSSIQTQENINLSGGSKRVKYFASLGYLYQEGLLKRYYEDYDPNFKANRYNYRTNLDIDVTKTTLLKINLGGIFEARNEPNYGSQNNMWTEILRSQPFSSPGFVDGKWVGASTYYIPMEMRDGLFGYYGKGYRKISRNTLNMDLGLTQKLDFITKGLSFEVKGAYNSMFQGQKTWSGAEEKYIPVYKGTILNPAIPFDNPAFTDTEIVYRQTETKSEITIGENYDKRSRDWYLEGSLRYNRRFGNHAVTGLFLYNESKKYYMANYTAIPRGYLGIVGRATYSYKDTYLFDINVGYNGSENFAVGNRFGTFPAASIGWILSEEKFLKENKFVNFLKLRASYGKVGNDRYLIGENDVRFLYLPDGFNPSAAGYNFGITTPQNMIGAAETMLGNSHVTWESAIKQNYGIDLSVLKQRLTFNADVFFENREDILVKQQTVPTHVAADLPVVNMGKVNNKGYEISVGWNDKSGNNFRYWVKANLSYSRNKIIYMDEVNYPEAWKGRTGRPVGTSEGYLFDRFFEESDFEESGKLKPGIPTYSGIMKPGDLMFKDLNEDNVIDNKDIAMFGYTERPEYVLGFVSGFEYKKFDFSMTWVGADNVTRALEADYRSPFNTGTAPLMQFMLDDKWTPERGQSAKFPRFTQANKEHNSQASSFWVRDASYIRLKNIEIGYSLSAKVLTKAGIQKIRFFANGYNLLTFDELGFIDPESKVGNANKYPNSKIYNFGLNINF